MHRRLITIAAAAVTAAALAGCSSGNDDTASSTTSSASQSTSAPVDVTAQLQSAGAGQPWAAAITSAKQTEADRVEVATSIVDPRGASGSPEAQQALAICQAAVDLLTGQGAAQPHVSVAESDGSTFVVAGNPSYGAACTEV